MNDGDINLSDSKTDRRILTRFQRQNMDMRLDGSLSEKSLCGCLAVKAGADCQMGYLAKQQTKKSPRWGSGLKDSHLGAALQCRADCEKFVKSFHFFSG
ncbi:hypothetical protein [Pseudomonas cannabina]|uniref:hypothetical protein n=1 Tax=Pseudomonas cannabina TaxID=86840 RepID=UPI000A8AE6D1|nr:hypothetical protein [Pseudomonas cannabina]KAA8714444.1 hypothetical protein F4W70_07355 [Pseudomonas cannabina]